VLNAVTATNLDLNACLDILINNSTVWVDLLAKAGRNIELSTVKVGHDANLRAGLTFPESSISFDAVKVGHDLTASAASNISQIASLVVTNQTSLSAGG